MASYVRIGWLNHYDVTAGLSRNCGRPARAVRARCPPRATRTHARTHARTPTNTTQPPHRAPATTRAHPHQRTNERTQPQLPLAKPPPQGHKGCHTNDTTALPRGTTARGARQRVRPHSHSLFRTPRSPVLSRRWQWQCGTYGDLDDDDDDDVLSRRWQWQWGARTDRISRLRVVTTMTTMTTMERLSWALFALL